MAFVTDSSVKKIVMKALNEELEQLKEAKTMGVWNSEQYKKRKAIISKKKADLRAGKYNL